MKIKTVIIMLLISSSAEAFSFFSNEDKPVEAVSQKPDAHFLSGRISYKPISALLATSTSKLKWQKLDGLDRWTVSYSNYDQGTNKTFDVSFLLYLRPNDKDISLAQCQVGEEVIKPNLFSQCNLNTVYKILSR